MFENSPKDNQCQHKLQQGMKYFLGKHFYLK